MIKILYRTIIAVILLTFIVLLSYKIFDQNTQLQQKKYDLAELESISYGLFNANAWAKKIAIILNKKIDEVKITEENRADYEKVIAQVLDQLIQETDNYIKKRNQSHDDDSFILSMKKIMKQGATDILIDFDDLRSNAIPKLSSTLLETLQEKQTRQQIKDIFSEKIDLFAVENFDQINLSRIDKINLQYNCESIDTCKEKLKKDINDISDLVAYEAGVTLLLTGLLFFTLLFRSKELSLINFSLLMFSLFILLLLGVFTSMIDIEAQISSFSFIIEGEEILFSEQILFFQSKSIFDVIMMLIQTYKIDMIFVGFLIGTFSILFPLFKIFASVLYIKDWYGLGTKKYIEFFALYSAKWSMADVMVVAMFMAFIGLDGMVSHQLNNLKVEDQNIDLLTYNGTSLEAGFYLFLGFVLFSMLISDKIKGVRAKNA